MSSQFRVTAKARHDIASIGRFTRRTWGAAQTARSLAEIDRRIQSFAADPRRGRPRGDIAANYFSYPQGAHLIFFMMDGDGVAIIGVPHQAMDLQAHFEEAALE